MVKIRVREAPWLSLRSNKNLNPNPHANRLSRPSHYLLQHPHTKVWRAATRAREAQLSLATFSRSRPSVMAKPGETGDASAVGVPGPVAGSAVLDRSTMFASVREPRLCTYEQHELVLLPGHLVFFAGWHARSCECAVPQDRDFWEPDVGVLVMSERRARFQPVRASVSPHT